MALIKILKDGQRYAERWPKHAVVAAFKESQIVPATRIGMTMMPAFAVINLMVQWQFNQQSFTPLAIAASLFLLSLPLQGLYWLGLRSRRELPPQLLSWYQELAKKLRQSRSDLRVKTEQVTYMDLALLLRKVLSILPPEDH